MTAAENRRQPPAGEWPAGGLESVDVCPICGDQRRRVLLTGLTDQAFLSAPGRWTLHRCGDCGAGYLDPRPTPETIGLAYSRYYTHAVAEDRAPAPAADAEPTLTRFAANRIARAMLHLLPGSTEDAEDLAARHLRPPAPGARLLDVGCGSGRFLLRAKSLGWDVYGIDPDPDAVAAARRSGLAIEQGALTDSTFPDGYFDAITLSHVIEHLHEPIATLRQCHRLLRPDGRLWIATPNLDAPGRGLFGESWRGLEPPRHLVIFTWRSLEQALREAGFRSRFERVVSCNAAVVFSASVALARGRDPYTESQPLERGLRLRALLADLGTLVRRESSEFIVVLGERE